MARAFTTIVASLAHRKITAWSPGSRRPRRSSTEQNQRVPLLIFIWIFGVPAAGRLVKDAFAGAVDVALDGAVGRGRDRAGSRGQRDRIGIVRRLHGRAEDSGSSLLRTRQSHGAMKAPCHIPAFGLARSGLFVALRSLWRCGQRPAPSRSSPAISGCPRHRPSQRATRAAAAVDRAGAGSPALAAGVLGQFVARRSAAGPALALGVEAELIDRRARRCRRGGCGYCRSWTWSASRIFGTHGDVGGAGSWPAATAGTGRGKTALNVIGNPRREIVDAESRGIVLANGPRASARLMARFQPTR